MNCKSTRDEARFPCIGSRAILHSTSNTIGLTSFRQCQRFPETPVSSLENHQFEYSNSRKTLCTKYCLEMRAHSLASDEEVSQISTSTSRRGFRQPHTYWYVRGCLSLLPQVEWTLRCSASKEGRISLQWLECRLIFHLTR